jgi:hypothetical protein
VIYLSLTPIDVYGLPDLMDRFGAEILHTSHLDRFFPRVENIAYAFMKYVAIF